MLIAALLAAAAPTIVTLPAKGQPPQALCRNPGRVLVDDRRGAPLIRPLDEEPPAQQIYAVLNTTPDGCVVPIVVRAEVGQRRR